MAGAQRIRGGDQAPTQPLDDDVSNNQRCGSLKEAFASDVKYGWFPTGTLK